MTFAATSALFAGILAKGGITLDPIAKPLAAVLAFFYSLVPNYGIAIVMLTIAMMAVLTPLTIKQTRSMLVMQKLQPQMKRLQEQHKNDRQALNEAVMQLYKEHNASPLGGCLPMLLPLPVFIALLRVLEGLSRHVNGAPMPKYLTTHTLMYKDIVAAGGKLEAFGMDLAKSASTTGGSFGHKLPYFVLLLLMVGTQYYQQHQLTSRNPQANAQPGQAAMMKFIPLFFGLISVRFPAGVVIYWTVSNLIRIGQQWAMYRYDPKVKALVAKDIKEIEAKTREIDAEDKKPNPVGRSRPEGRPGPAGRSRIRDLLSNAAEAAADKRQNAATRAPKPGDKPASGKAGAGSQKPGTARPAAKGVPKPGVAKNAPAKGAPAKGVPAKGVPAKSVSGKAIPAKGSAPTKGGTPGKAGGTNAAAPGRTGPAKPGTGSNGTAKPAAKAQPAAKNPQPAAKPAVANPSRPAGHNEPNGANKPSTGSADGAAGNGKGRTGAGGARSVSSRHRRARRGR